MNTHGRGRRYDCLFATGAAAVLLAACSSIPQPRTGPVPGTARAVEVPYPPPPARVEVVPPPKAKTEVWVNGQWEWTADSWKWVAGTWVSPPAGAYFTPWSTVRKPDGRLFFTAATWRDRKGEAIDIGWGSRVCPVPPANSNEVANKP